MIPVGVLGATGIVGQKLLQLLETHPWFEPTHLMASPRSEGRDYGQWAPNSPYATNKITRCIENPRCDLLFSCLDATVAHVCELRYAQRGFPVVSNAKSHRNDPDVPILIPEVNAEHLSLIDTQQHAGCIVTNPNCSVSGIALALKPLNDHFKIKHVNVTTLQAISGAGSLISSDIENNLFPHIAGEEEKICNEPQKILGSPTHPATFTTSATSFRVPISDGHTAAITVELETPASQEEIIDLWNTFPRLDLPSAPSQPILYDSSESAPQPRLHRERERGMGVTIGRLRKINPTNYQFIVLTHNLVRGAAGNALLIAEQMVSLRVKRLQLQDLSCPVRAQIQL